MTRREHGGGRADAERKREDADEREERVLDQLPQRETDFFDHGLVSSDVAARARDFVARLAKASVPRPDASDGGGSLAITIRDAGARE